MMVRIKGQVCNVTVSDKQTMAGAAVGGEVGADDSTLQAPAGQTRRVPALYTEQTAQTDRGHCPIRLASLLPRLLHEHLQGNRPTTNT